MCSVVEGTNERCRKKVFGFQRDIARVYISSSSSLSLSLYLGTFEKGKKNESNETGLIEFQ